MNKQKVQAFTILELTITMLITALLIGVAYASYSIIVKSYRSFNLKNEDMGVLISLDHVLKRDFDQADVILKTSDGITLKSEQKIIKYTFNPGFITRESVKTDTFKVETQLVQTSFETTAVNDIQDTEEQSQLDDLTFSLLYQNEKIPYHYHKSYSSVNLIKRNPNAIH
jgi:Tfp pilus assembly protein PilE